MTKIKERHMKIFDMYAVYILTKHPGEYEAYLAQGKEDLFFSWALPHIPGAVEWVRANVYSYTTPVHALRAFSTALKQYKITTLDSRQDAKLQPNAKIDVFATNPSDALISAAILQYELVTLVSAPATRKRYAKILQLHKAGWANVISGSVQSKAEQLTEAKTQATARKRNENVDLNENIENSAEVTAVIAIAVKTVQAADLIFASAPVIEPRARSANKLVLKKQMLQAYREVEILKRDLVNFKSKTDLVNRNELGALHSKEEVKAASKLTGKALKGFAVWLRLRAKTAASEVCMLSAACMTAGMDTSENPELEAAILLVEEVANCRN